MPLHFQKMIYRSDLKSNPYTFYVFGDNTRRKGLGGQAGQMRYEPNAIGVATKWVGDCEEASYFTDAPECWAVVRTDLDKVENALKQGVMVIMPEDGLGTGLSELPTRAPRLNEYIQERINDLAHRFPEKIARSA